MAPRTLTLAQEGRSGVQACGGRRGDEAVDGGIGRRWRRSCQFARQVDERTAGVARVDAGVGLYEPIGQAGVDEGRRRRSGAGWALRLPPLLEGLAGADQDAID